VVAVSADARDDLDALAARFGLTFPLVSDPALDVARAYGVRQADRDVALPATFVAAHDGRILFAHVGAHPLDRPPVGDVVAALRR
jgi:peroxiredoxin